MRACKHGLSRTPEYAAWAAMRHRCEVPTSQAYRNYGGRGIVVCQEWSDVRRFVADMGPRPSRSHTLDREDNDGPYCKSNCRWATVKDQNANRSISRRLEAFGETKSVADWCSQFGIKYTTLLARIERWGWSVEKSLQTPTGSIIKTRNELGQYQ